MYAQWSDEFSITQYHAYVRHVRTDCVTDTQANISLSSGHRHNKYLRRRRFFSNYGEPNNERRHTQVAYCRRSAQHEAVCCPHQHHKPNNHGDSRRKHVGMLTLLRQSGP